jgi:hypothetical protein
MSSASSVPLPVSLPPLPLPSSSSPLRSSSPVLVSLPRGSVASLRHRELTGQLLAHHANLKNARSVIHSWNERHFTLRASHVQNRNSARFHREREAAIERENLRMVERITGASQRVSTRHHNGNIHNPHNEAATMKQKNLAKRSLNYQRRKAESERIERENLFLASRIINQPATYKRQEFQDFSLAHNKDLMNLSRYSHKLVYPSLPPTGKVLSLPQPHSPTQFHYRHFHPQNPSNDQTDNQKSNENL